MVLGGLEFVIGAKLVGAKLLAAHGAHALAAKGAVAAQHPVPAATHMAIHHGITYAINNPAVSAATAAHSVPALTPGATAAVLSHGTTGAAGAAATPSAPVNVLHVARELAIPVATAVASRQIRKTDQYREAKAALSELFDMVKEELQTSVTGAVRP
jgi:hypothetical protein